MPELRNVPTDYIHEPWLMPGSERAAIGLSLGKDYPEVAVEHSEARQRALDAYAKIKKVG